MKYGTREIKQIKIDTEYLLIKPSILFPFLSSKNKNKINNESCNERRICMLILGLEKRVNNEVMTVSWCRPTVVTVISLLSVTEAVTNLKLL